VAGRASVTPPGAGRLRLALPVAFSLCVGVAVLRYRLFDIDRIIAAFAARLQDAVDLDAVRADLAGFVQQALEPAHISVWTWADGRQ
jgi:hypothetical protein